MNTFYQSMGDAERDLEIIRLQKILNRLPVAHSSARFEIAMEIDRIAGVTAPVSIPIPKDITTAHIMANLGLKWLQENAPDHLTEFGRTANLAAVHADDKAINLFADSMKAKMAKMREKGRGGWADTFSCSTSLLQKEASKEIEKGDPVDIGNLAMMLFNRGATYIPPAPAEDDTSEQEAALSLAIEVEKLLCKALGREWSVTGISIESLIDEISKKIPKKEKMAPVQGYPGGIPWAIHLEAYEVYCKRYGKQEALIDLEGKGCRGGFGTGELDMFIPGWRDRVAEFGKMKARIAELESARPLQFNKAIELAAELIESRAWDHFKEFGDDFQTARDNDTFTKLMDGLAKDIRALK
jgi:hypothetical protein